MWSKYSSGSVSKPLETIFKSHIEGGEFHFPNNVFLWSNNQALSEIICYSCILNGQAVTPNKCLDKIHPVHSYFKPLNDPLNERQGNEKFKPKWSREKDWKRNCAKSLMKFIENEWKFKWHRPFYVSNNFLPHNHSFIYLNMILLYAQKSFWHVHQLSIDSLFYNAGPSCTKYHPKRGIISAWESSTHPYY